MSANKLVEIRQENNEFIVTANEAEENTPYEEIGKADNFFDANDMAQKYLEENEVEYGIKLTIVNPK